jgi:hypothetical protein
MIMDIKKHVYSSLAKASLEEVLDITDVHNLDWFWINRDIFEDILKNIPDFDYYAMEDEVNVFLNRIKDEEFIKPLREGIERRGFIEIAQEFFAKIDKDYRVIKDIETWIFIKDSYYNKLWIKRFNELEWVLKAMAINTYQRLDFPYSSLLETYRELFESNNRIIEDILLRGEYVLEGGKWILNEKMGILTFYKNNKAFYEWGEGEVEFKFDELQLP